MGRKSDWYWYGRDKYVWRWINKERKVTNADMAKISMCDVPFYKERKVTDANLDKISMRDVAFYKERKVTDADIVGIHELCLL